MFGVVQYQYQFGKDRATFSKSNCDRSCGGETRPGPEGAKRATSVNVATSAPAEGPAYELGLARRCEFPLRAPQACNVYGRAWAFVNT